MYFLFIRGFIRNVNLTITITVHSLKLLSLPGSGLGVYSLEAPASTVHGRSHAQKHSQAGAWERDTKQTLIKDQVFITPLFFKYASI